MKLFSYANSLIFKGGFLMWPLIFLSVAGWAIAAERLRMFMRLPKEEEARQFARKIYSYIRKEEWDEAESECNRFDHPLGRLFQAGIDVRS